jgi:asparagine synthase (glutamine-hydrolysing)
VERSLSSSSDIILNKGFTKWILRESMKNILPEKIRQRRDKIGFGSPADDWFREKYMMEMIFDILDSKVLNQSGYLNVDFCKKRYNLHFQNRLNISQEIWRWISLYFFLSNFRKRI